ncbi:hypothetical protein BDQ94DRAFT_161089 [Aspergillus welwitschiae]|uniref:Uncharacterized protein n=1 Tax=Aspergillus welwitschiae TaxID=1341132 RepID=A0A3F3PVY9_9EURO|nr:hypothetical protein BDQ94DRAFT_161089 [Aspergillus welwitschiae]RDH30912.1 hypothetical protein BDQ94DRAFT_161089 [Aspergillus welwitschiae]
MPKWRLQTLIQLDFGGPQSHTPLLSRSVTSNVDYRGPLFELSSHRPSVPFTKRKPANQVLTALTWVGPLPSRQSVEWLNGNPYTVLCLRATASEIEGSQHDFGPDSISILRISLAVCRGYYRSVDMELLDNNRLLDDHIERLMHNLDVDTILKLALLTWHFDASSQRPYEELLRFFSQPDEEGSEVYIRICERYSNHTRRRVYVLQGEWSVI